MPRRSRCWKALKPIRAVLPPLSVAAEAAIKTARERQKGFVEGHKAAKFTPVLGLNGASWMATYTAAVSAGAVAPADTLADKLREALDAADKSWELFLPMATQAPFRKAHEQAPKTQACLQAAVRLVERFAGWPGYDQPVMKAFLEKDLKGGLEKVRLKHDLLKKALGGTLAEFKLKLPIDVKPSEFEAAVKTAVADGIATDTGRDPRLFVSMLIADIAELDKIKSNPQVPQSTKDKRRRLVKDTAARLRYQLSKLKEGCENQNWIDYVDVCAAWLEKRVKAADTLDPVEVEAKKKATQTK